MASSARIAAIPVGPAGLDPSPLWQEIEAGVAVAAKEGAILAVLPELSALPYVAGEDPRRWSHVAEPLGGPTCERMGEFARRFGIPILFGMALAEGPGLPVNAAMLARPNGEAGRIAGKMRLPPRLDGDLFGEADHFRCVPPGIGIVAIKTLRVATLVCFDRRFADHWRQAAEAGADLIAVLVAGPAPGDPPSFFAEELRGHVRHNAVQAVSAARYGIETLTGRPVRHDGDTVILGRDGTVLARADPNRPRTIVATIDVPAGVRNVASGQLVSFHP